MNRGRPGFAAAAVSAALAFALSACRPAALPAPPASVPRPAPAPSLPAPAPVCFVHDDAGADAAFSKSRALAASRRLALSGLEAPVFPMGALATALAAPCRVAHFVFPGRFSAGDLAAVRAFVAGGGRLVVHGADDPGLCALFGLRPPALPGLEPEKGAWTGFDFCEPPPLHAPASVAQAAPRVLEPAPAGKDVRVLARWRAPGESKRPPALLRGPAGFWLVRPLYDDLPAADASRLLLSLTATLDPPAWKTAAKALETQLPAPAAWKALDRDVRRLGDKAREGTFAALEARWRALDRERRDKAGQGLYGASLAPLWKMEETLVAAEALARPLGPDRGAARLAVWAKGGWPPGTNTWESAAEALAKAGATDVYLYAGSLAASIPAVPGVPADPGRSWRGDPFPAAVAACHARGIRVHAWIFALQAGTAPGARHDAAKNDRRLLHAPGRASALPWLDPAVAANGDDLVAFVRALATRTGVDGVNLDYFRYPLEATEEKRDPAALRALLGRIRKDLRVAAPRCELSVDVYAYTSTIAQDWDEWLAADLADRALVMNYAPDVETLRRYMALHPKNRKKQLCGIGASSSQSLLAPRDLLAQLREAYRAGYAGAAVYPFDERFLADYGLVLRLAR